MDEEERSKRIRTAAIRWTWAILAVGCFLGLLLPLTSALQWWDASAMCLLGVLTGLAVAYAVLHSEARSPVLLYVAIALGFVVLPALAVVLGGIASSQADAFANWNATLTAFVVYALATAVLRLALAAIWRPRESAQDAGGEQVEQLAEWQVLEGESLPERPAVEPTPPTQQPVPPLRAQGG